MISEAIAGTVLKAAIKVGAPMVKEILADRLGAGGAVAGTIIDMVAGKAGVPVQDLPQANSTDIERAVRQVEQESPELVLAYVEAQRESNRLMLAEMDKSESVWAWAWRPAWMWLLGFFWSWALVVQPVIKAALWPEMILVDLTTLMGVTGIYLSLYMGGHTIKAAVTRPSPSAGLY